MANQQAAKRVYNVERFILLDNTEVEVKDLPIKKLRKAQDLINKAMSGEPVLDDDGEPVIGDNGEPEVKVDEDAVYDAFFTIVELVMAGQEKCEKFLEPDNGRELLEDTLDQDTLYEIVRVSTGFDFLRVQRMVDQMMEKEVTR
jgi:hypothetical protein